MIILFSKETNKGKVVFRLENPVKCYKPVDEEYKDKNGKMCHADTEIEEAKSYFNMDGQEEVPFLNYWNLD